jgi:hypothetical protein
VAKKTVHLAMPKPTSAAAWVAGRDESGAPMKRFTIDVTEELHTRIKVECSKRHAKMADVIRDLLEREFPK